MVSCDIVIFAWKFSLPLGRPSFWGSV